MSTIKINNRAIMLGAVTIGGLLVALWAGKAVALGNTRPLLMGLAASIALAMGLALGRNAWILIPVTFFATGSIGALPLPFNYQELGIMAAFTLFILHLILTKETIRITHSAVDTLVWVNVAYLISVFFRNPVGVAALQTELVGGRPYFSLLLMVFCYIVLSHVRVDEKRARQMAWILAGAMITPQFLLVLTEFVPSTSRVIYPFYSGVNIEEFNLGLAPAEGAQDTRITSFMGLGRPMVLALCALYPPITLVNPLRFQRFAAFLTGLVLGALSGFRNLLVAFAFYLVIGSMVRRRYLDVFVLGTLGVCAVTLVGSAHLVGVPVPFAVQRALSFIPLGWDENAVRSAKGTEEWRYEMWQDAWTRPGHIRSKLLGDGYGFTQKEMMIMSDELLGLGGFMNAASYEGHLIRGSYHSGPLSTVKRVGYVGGVCLLALMIASFTQSLKLVKKTRNTPFFTWTLFIAIPILFLPFEFFFLFGDYIQAMTLFLFSAGMFKMIENSLAKWQLMRAATGQSFGTKEQQPMALKSGL